MRNPALQELDTLDTPPSTTRSATPLGSTDVAQDFDVIFERA
jgi:hypothetical protein